MSVSDNLPSEQSHTSEANQQSEHGNQEKSATLPQGLEDWVGDGKKYSNMDKAIGSIPHAQKRILELEQQLKEQQDKLATSSDIDRILERIGDKNTDEGMSTTPANTTETNVNHLTEDRVLEILRSQEADKIYAQNEAQISQTMKERFRDKSKDMWNKMADELGTSVKELDELSRTKPKLVMALIDRQAAPNNGAQTASPSFSGNSYSNTDSSYNKPTYKQFKDSCINRSGGFDITPELEAAVRQAREEGRLNEFFGR